jgi:chemotaxis protein methyltransferase CheR
MTEQDFDFIRKFLLYRAAIVLEPGKQYLVEARLGPIVRQMQLGSLEELIARLRTQPVNGLCTRVVEAMVTTETSFFRDAAPFEAIRKAVLPDLIQRRSNERRLAIWCAACSSGQEPYSIALLLREHFPQLGDWKVTLITSDISAEMLARAREGRYSQLEVNRGMPAALLVKYFQQHGTSWQLRDEVRRIVGFQEMNLARPWPFLPRMDLVLLRNVMIYFDIETKKTILRRVASLLRPDGYLLLGSAETTFNLDPSYQRVELHRAGFYQLVG